MILLFIFFDLCVASSFGFVQHQLHNVGFSFLLSRNAEAEKIKRRAHTLVNFKDENLSPKPMVHALEGLTSLYHTSHLTFSSHSP